MEIEIGRGKKARRAYGFDDIAIVPSRRTRDPDDIDISWKLGPYQFELPLLAAAMDGVVSPETAGIVGKLGGLAVLNLEGIFTRYEDADAQLERIAELPKHLATREMQEIYREPVKPELIVQRIQEIKEQKVVVAASLTPQRVRDHYELALDAGLDVLVIQGTVVSGEHVSTVSEPLNLKEFIPSLDVPVVVGGCASYHTGLHLMRTGAAGVLVGVGPGAACTTRGVLGIGVPQATAIADVAHARSTHMLETGEYCQVIADGGMRNGGDVAKAIALGADAVMLGSPLARAYEAPGRGFHWGMATFHPTLPRGARVATTQNGTLEEILVGPARENDGTFNLFGGLRTSMATCGHKDLAEFNRAEVVIAPALQTEGKALQRDQEIGMGAVNGKAAVLVEDWSTAATAAVRGAHRRRLRPIMNGAARVERGIFTTSTSARRAPNLFATSTASTTTRQAHRLPRPEHEHSRDQNLYGQADRTRARVGAARCQRQDARPARHADRRPAARQAQARLHAAHRHRRLRRGDQRREDRRHGQQAHRQALLPSLGLSGWAAIAELRGDDRAPPGGGDPARGERHDAA